MGDRLPFYLCEKGDYHGKLTDKVEYGERKTEPDLLIPFDMHHTLIFDDINVNSRKNILCVRIYLPRKAAACEKECHLPGLGICEGDSEELEYPMEELGAVIYADGSAGKVYHKHSEDIDEYLLKREHQASGIYYREHIKAHEAEADIIEQTLPYGLRLTACVYVRTVCSAAGYEDMLEELGARFNKRLKVTLCPSDSLAHCDLHINRLLVVELCRVVIGYLISVGYGISAERSVLSKACIVPAVLDNLP